jgi:D-alanyl-D-alanine carboxypeptidase/D-alanyl-D-alanine-endopeptidase (penicillin-binding protein 4)
MFLSASKKFKIFILLFFCLAIEPPGNLYSKNLIQLDNYIGKHDAVLLADHNSSIIFAENADTKLVPASTLKILTSLAALHYLGPDYRFTTEFYLDNFLNLKIKGYGDPLLLSEIIMDISGILSRKLESTGKRLNDILLDDSYFQNKVVCPGRSISPEPYDAPNGALCANFNTVNFKKTASERWVSAEPQTPLLPFAITRIRESNIEEGRIVLSHQKKEIAMYTGQLFHYFLTSKGVMTSGTIRAGIVDSGKDKLILKYHSKYSLEQVIAKLLKFSNNFMANQIFLATGASVFGPPGNFEKGAEALSAYTAEKLKINKLQMLEGSGLSRDNRISAKDMLKVLEKFEPYQHLMPARENEFYKTGTLKGIAARAGYIKNKNGKLYRYIVFLNTSEKSISRIMDEIRYIANHGSLPVIR